MKKIIRVTSLVAALSITAVMPFSGELFQERAFAAQDKSEFTPYYGNGPSYIQPENIAHLFPSPHAQFTTPGFAKGKIAFTSQEEMMSFIKKLSNKNKNVHLKILGQSLEGRDIPLLLFTKDNPEKVKNNKKKPLIWIQGQIHGNEPAAGESTLVMAQMIAEGKLGDVLDQVNIAIVPRVNPDGSYNFKRYIATNLDANRDYIKVEYPEVQLINQAVNEYQPEVVLDTHEYTVNSSLLKKYGEKGSIASYDLLISPAKNLNIPEKLRKASEDLLLPEVQKVLDKEKLTHHDYYTLGTNDSGKLVATEGSTEARIGRNALGLKNTLTYLIETRGINIGRENFERRVYAQTIAQSNFIKSTAKHADQIKKLVSNARQEIVAKGKQINDNDKIVITSENKLIADQLLDVIDLAKGERTAIPIDWKDSNEAYATLERERPTAYIMPPAYHDIARKLEILGVKVEKLSKPMELQIEGFKVIDNKVSTTLENGHYTNQVTTEVTTKEQTFPKGSYIFNMSQANANVIAIAFEPESIDSYVTFNFIPVEKGDEIPIYRYMKEGKLPTK
ncbi:M14 family metallopeptidase [Heyndrickxia oleronia]|uniref:M14 family metallopeptidase n=1 Tax=Heyndrickxia oleronia TaxID=38875 RepID=A0AAW6SZF2_9BACI|nr:M14 family metallopeptidase [Heyndrickxia oleronia]MDH5162217.1 M14 family metallopeptidase [Heyndrickxia oleronia]